MRVRNAGFDVSRIVIRVNPRENKPV